MLQAQSATLRPQTIPLQRGSSNACVRSASVARAPRCLTHAAVCSRLTGANASNRPAHRQSMAVRALPGGEGSDGPSQVKDEVKKSGITPIKIIGWLTYIPGIYIVCSFLYRYYVRHF
mmetsp:Transcript_11701/g.35118  ORF Transcript_11701/g.35118 Transcript_11701/m.35118 type:complete len:118 (-) Transcript_11701:248-601(-)